MSLVFIIEFLSGGFCIIHNTNSRIDADDFIRFMKTFLPPCKNKVLRGLMNPQSVNSNRKFNQNWRTFLSVQRPGRYASVEWNCIIKSADAVSVRMALAFPDVYEIGMSYHGYKILYERINGVEDFAAERVFAPWSDAERLMKERKEPLRTLETETPLADFEVIGFTLQHELIYTNILTMLDCAGVPLLATERKPPFPLVIGGGEGALTPETLADFFDAFVIGDGEDAAIEILQAVKEFKNSGQGDKKDLLRQLSRIEGVYVPSFYKPEYQSDGRLAAMNKIEASAPDVIRARRFNIADDLGSVAPVVPSLRVTQDRLAIELRRGCVHGCRFCQAGMTNRPVRERPVSQILEIAREGIRRTGAEDISLLSLSSADYSRLPEVLELLKEEWAPHGVSLSLPSIRINSCDLEILDSVSTVRHTGLTLAPEAGTERLRRVINKPVDQAMLLDLAQRAFSAGRQTLKLYFMIGLPTETNDDLEGIVQILREVENIARRKRGRNYQINVTLSPFVPKAHTPFQWEHQCLPDVFKEKIQYIRSRIKSGKIVFKSHDLQQSLLEAILARGDRRLGSAILRAWEDGCRFDGWEELFRYTIWEQAFSKTGIEPSFYAHRERTPDEILPWDHIHAGVSKEFLKRERQRAYECALTEECTTGACAACGACPDGKDNILAPAEEIKRAINADGITKIFPLQSGDMEKPPIQRLRLTYSKHGAICLISHLDLGKTIFTIMKRTAIPVSFTKGFNPQPKVQYGPPLSVGFESEGELIDIFLIERRAPKEILKSLRSQSPRGLEFIAAEEIPLSAPAPSAAALAAEYEMILPTEWDSLDWGDALNRWKKSTALSVEIPKRDKILKRDLKKTILNLEQIKRAGENIKNAFRIAVALDEQNYLDPRIAFAALCLLPLENIEQVQVRRLRIILP
ncbi:MAG TPA: TIGR03960 family B12-binding radical SAM protein [Candidatus Sumerlaeia bacterium]|nr:TIGR03960 family B12-binding radical SAM protein [Candidatus Sumerlaeia bacterium]